MLNLYWNFSKGDITVTITYPYHLLEWRHSQPMRSSDETFFISFVSEPDYGDAVSDSG